MWILCGCIIFAHLLFISLNYFIGRISILNLDQKPQYSHTNSGKSRVSLQLLEVILKTCEKCISVAAWVKENNASAYLKAKFSFALCIAEICSSLSTTNVTVWLIAFLFKCVLHFAKAYDKNKIIFLFWAIKPPRISSCPLLEYPLCQHLE